MVLFAVVLLHWAFFLLSFLSGLGYAEGRRRRGRAVVFFDQGVTCLVCGGLDLCGMLVSLKRTWLATNEKLRSMDRRSRQVPILSW